jgi:hypothetical protein
LRLTDTSILEQRRLLAVQGVQVLYQHHQVASLRRRRKLAGRRQLLGGVVRSVAVDDVP